MQHIEDMIKEVDFSRGSDLEARLEKEIFAVRSTRRKVTVHDLEEEEQTGRRDGHAASDAAASRRSSRQRQKDAKERKGSGMSRETP